VQEGSSATVEEYKVFIRSLVQFDYGDPVAIDKIRNSIDLPNYYDYMILHTFFAPYDWPNDNIKLWRSAKNAPNSKADLTKWRWMITDWILQDIQRLIII
jgi:hypothetical protein